MTSNNKGKFIVPRLNVEDILNLKKCPKPVQYIKGDRALVVKATEYAIYRYVVGKASIVDIANELGDSPYQTVLYWLKQNNVYTKKTPEQRGNDHPLKLRTPEFCKQAKAYYDSGVKTYAEISRKMKCGETLIRNIAKDNGWAHENYYKKFKWLTPKNLPKNTIDDFKTYRSYIYHFTNQIAKQYLSEDDLKKLKTGVYDVDHMLSIWEAFNKGNEPLPWQMICHPANLQVITWKENLIKGRNSSFNPSELKSRIRVFEKEKGKVPLPIEVVPIPKYQGSKLKGKPS